MLYTRKGDTGTTGVFGCKERFSKAHELPEALGTLDELNSYVGLCRAYVESEHVPRIPAGKQQRTLERVLHDVQQALFIVQAELAGADKCITKTKVTGLEIITNSIEAALPPITSFTIPGATVLAGHLDVARTLARRAERRVVGVHERNVRTIGAHTLAYLNRLSSLLFALARYTNHEAGAAEESPTYR